MTVKIVQEMVTPDRASDFLSRNEGNRRVSQIAESALVRDIVNGNYHLNGDTIKISPEGYLLDGQHRLRAVVKSGMTVPMLVAYGVPPEAIATIDRGKKRSHADILHFNGYTQCSNLATLATIAWQYDRKNMCSNVTPTGEEMIQYIADNPDLLDANQVGSQLYKGRGCLTTKAMISSMYFLFSRKAGKDEAYSFVKRMVEGIDVQEGSPMHTLRNKLQSYMNNIGSPPRKLIAAFIIKAWNAERNGTQLKNLRMGENEAFPEVV